MLPPYLAKAVANPPGKRLPWYSNIAPSYFGTFLWIAFFQSMAVGTINRASLGVCLAALAVAALLSHALWYYVPAMLGMKTGFSLYVVGSSTFGTKGGYLMPGLLMGVLQVGWYSVSSFFAIKFILTGFGFEARPGSLPFILVGILWGYSMAYVGVKGVRYVAKLSLFLNIIPFVMVLFVFYKTQPGMGQHVPSDPNSFIAFTMLIQMVIGFFATAGAAGTDFGMSARNRRDVCLGGLFGISLAILYAGGLPLMSVAGAQVLFPHMQGLTYDAVITALGGWLAKAMFLLFAVASIPPACFCGFIIGNSFATMIPSVSRMTITMLGVTVSIVLAVTGVAENLVSFFTIAGASFGPICGAMVADYLLSGRRWAGPREGINLAGYIAWALGFVVGNIPFLPVSDQVKTLAQPAVVYSFLTGFAVYWILAKAGLQPKTVAMPAAIVSTGS